MNIHGETISTRVVLAFLLSMLCLAAAAGYALFALHFLLEAQSEAARDGDYAAADSWFPEVTLPLLSLAAVLVCSAGCALRDKGRRCHVFLGLVPGLFSLLGLVVGAPATLQLTGPPLLLLALQFLISPPDRPHTATLPRPTQVHGDEPPSRPDQGRPEAGSPGNPSS